MIDVESILDGLGIVVVNVGTTSISCRCPLTPHEHEATKPGFSVYQDTGQWICFKNCGQGSLTTLVSRLLSLSSSEAQRWLLTHGGEVTSEALIRDLEPRVDPKAGPSSSYLQFIASDYAQQVSTRTSQYIIDRGFTIQTIKAWGIRYDPEVPAIVIPIYDIRGQLVGLSRREVVPQSQPSKYMESVGFDKNQHLFGAHRHVPQGRVVIVEGPLDCIWLHQCGVTDAVALMGTYCSMAKQRLLARLGSHIVLALDNDAAGHSATRWLSDQLSAWFSVTVQRLPESVKDVQELSAAQVKLLFRW